MKAGWQPNTPAVQQLVTGARARIAIREILRILSERFEIDPAMIRGPSRQRSHVGARHIAMWLTRNLTTLSLPEVGREFGHRHHTSVLYATYVVDQLRKSHPETRAMTDEIFAQLCGMPLD